MCLIKLACMCVLSLQSEGELVANFVDLGFLLHTYNQIKILKLINKLVTYKITLP